MQAFILLLGGTRRAVPREHVGAELVSRVSSRLTLVEPDHPSTIPSRLRRGGGGAFAFDSQDFQAGPCTVTAGDSGAIRL